MRAFALSTDSQFDAEENLIAAVPDTASDSARYDANSAADSGTGRDSAAAPELAPFPNSEPDPESGATSAGSSDSSLFALSGTARSEALAARDERRNAWEIERDRRNAHTDDRAPRNAALPAGAAGSSAGPTDALTENASAAGRDQAAEGANNARAATPPFGFDIYARIEAIDGQSVYDYREIAAAYKGKGVNDTFEIRTRRNLAKSSPRLFRRSSAAMMRRMLARPRGRLRKLTYHRVGA